MGHLGEIRVAPLSSKATKRVGENKAGTRRVTEPGGTSCHALREAETPGQGFLDTREVLSLSNLASASPPYLFDPQTSACVRDEPNIPHHSIPLCGDTGIDAPLCLPLPKNRHPTGKQRLLCAPKLYVMLLKKL